MRIQCNARIRVTNLVGDLPRYGPVWFDPRAIANVLSLKLVKEKYHIKYNSAKDDGFVVTKPTREKFKFIQSGLGLHYLDTMVQDTNKSVNTTLVVNMVKENKKNYTNNDYLCALRAWELQVTMGGPSTATFVEALKINVLLNCPVTPADVEGGGRTNIWARHRISKRKNYPKESAYYRLSNFTSSSKCSGAVPQCYVVYRHQVR